MIRKAIASLLGAATLSLSVGPALSETLGDALVKAYRNSNLLESNRALLRAADEDVAQAMSALRPVISFLARAGDTDTSDLATSATLSAELLVYDFGRTRLGVDAAKETVLATRASLRSVEQEVLLGAVTAYMDMIQRREFVQLSQNNLRLITRELRAARDRFEVGEVTRTDVSLAESRLAESRSNLVAAEGNLEIARAAYELAVGAPPGALAAPPAPPRVPASVAAAQRLGQQSHPAIERAQRLVKAAELNVARAAAAMRPRATLGANATYNFDPGPNQDRDTAGIELGLSVPIYQGGGLASAYRQAIARAASARSELLQASLAVDDGVARAWAQLKVASATIVARREQIRAAELAFEGVREEATLGARTTLDVLDAEQELLTARSNLVAAERDRYVAIYALLSAMGLLNADYLGLGVEQYDPTAYYNAVQSAPAHSDRGRRLDRILERAGRN